ncbi:hypothetical protein Tco_1116358, partial [Tanacetum coccineum]
NMANENVPAPTPTRSDDQTLPFADGCLLERATLAFTASASVPAIYIQQFWNTLTYEAKTGKTSGFDRPRYPVLQMLWGIITSTNVDYAELMWEELLQAMQTFLVDKANLSTAPQKAKKTKPHVIPYCRFTKLIICHLGRTHNIHQRSASPFHLAEEDHRLGNLKFVPKGKEDEVFGMQIPKELIMNNIRNAPYYNAYLEIVAKHDQKTVAEEGGKKKSATKADKSKKPATAKQLKMKHVKEKSRKPAPVQKSKSPLQLIDKDESTQLEPEPKPEYQAPVGGVAIREPVAEATLQLPVVEGKGKAIATNEQAALSLLDLHKPKRRNDTSANIVCETPSPADAETGADTDKVINEGDTKILNFGEEQGEDVDNQVNLEEKTAELNEGQAGSDPGKTPESRPPPEQVLMKEDHAGIDPGQSHVALAGPNPEPMHDDFVATVHPQVHESLKHITEEHVQMDNPLSSTKTLSSMKNLDNFNFDDEFIDDKSPEDESGNGNVDTEVESMVTILIHQASSSVLPLSTPVIDLSPPKPKSKTLDNTTQNLGSRGFTLELRDLPHKINQTVNDVVKEAVHVAFQVPLQDRFRELLEADMKEIIHQRMFESGSYIRHPEHDESRKRRRDDQDPHPPPPDSYLSKKKRHDSNSSGSKQPPAPQSSAWKTSDTREAPSSSSKQKSAPHSKQPVKDVPIPDDFQMEECYLMLTDQVDLVNPEGHRVVLDVSKPLPLRGPPGRRSDLSISKLKATQYLDFGLEELVLSLWIESEHDYDISAAYGISYWWFKRKEVYITRHSAPSDRSTVRSHMQILSVISEANFKNLHPKDFEDLYMLHLQGHLNHLSGADKVHLFNADASDFLFKEDYTILSKPRAIIYKDKNDQKKMMRETEVHKFSDGTLNRILDKLDHMVKDFKLFKYNPGMETRIWSEDDR